MLHGIIETNDTMKGTERMSMKRCSRQSKNEISSRIYSDGVEIECSLDRDGYGGCQIRNLRGGEVIGDFRVTGTPQSWMRPVVSVRKLNKLDEPGDLTAEEYYESH